MSSPASTSWQDHRVTIVHGIGDKRIGTGEEFEARPLGSFWNLTPTNRPKHRGLAFIPSTYHEHDAREHKTQRALGQFVALVGDVDKGQHPIGKIEACLDAIAPGCARLIYSTPNACPENRRWRIILPLADPAEFAIWRDAQEAMFELMGARGVEMDGVTERAGQIAFLPNVPARNEDTGQPLRGEDGEPLYFTIRGAADGPGLSLRSGEIGKAIADIHRRRAEDERLREKMAAEASRRRANAPVNPGSSVIDTFNQSVAIADLLAAHGYEQSPRNPADWRSRYQTSGTFATRVMGDKWVSLSSSDAAAGIGSRCDTGCYGDAYDLFVHYEHGGNPRSAWKAACEEQGRASTPRERMNGSQPPPRDDGDPGWTEHPDEAFDFDAARARAHSRGGENADRYDPGTGGFHGNPEPPSLLPIVDFADWAGKSPPARMFAWGNQIPLMTTTMLTGPGGVGKSLFEQMLLTCIALGVPFLGIETRQMSTLYVTCEDDVDELWRRQDAICAALGVSVEDLKDKLHLVSLCGVNETALASFDENEMIVVSERWRQLVHTCEQRQIRLYAFDNATDAMAGDLNDIHQVAEFVNLLTGLALRMNGAAMILHHPNKAGDDWLGSVAWHNKVRSRMIIKRSEVEGDDDGRVLENPKANYGPSGGKINFTWFRGAFVRAEDLPPDVASEMAENVRMAGGNKRFLECLRKATEEGRNVSHSASASNYAPKLFAEMTIGKGYSKGDYKAAMERLLHLGKIEAGKPVFQYENRTWAYGLRIAQEGAQGPGEAAQNVAQSPHKASHKACTEGGREMAKNGQSDCTEPHNGESLYTTYIEGAAPRGSAAPSHDPDNPMLTPAAAEAARSARRSREEKADEHEG